jgi:hypothetical protein
MHDASRSRTKRAAFLGVQQVRGRNARLAQTKIAYWLEMKRGVERVLEEELKLFPRLPANFARKRTI